jgi:hypothetical protein
VRSSDNEAAAADALPPPWPQNDWPTVTVTSATRLEPDGPTRRFQIRLWLANGARPRLILTACPHQGASIEIPAAWPHPGRWRDRILTEIRRTWPVLLANTPPAPAQGTLESTRRKPGRPRGS